MNKAKLYYVHDPMCAWCWGYQPAWQVIEQTLVQNAEPNIEIVYLVGGLAPDSDEPMPAEMQRQIRSYWQKIEDYLGTQFNYDFWNNNTPRRSTYPACRAVLAAREQGAEKAMIRAIQEAYYLRSLNPSDVAVLVRLAQELKLDSERFSQQMQSTHLDQTLLEEISFARSIGGNSFPSLFVEREDHLQELPIEYDDPRSTLNLIDKICR